MVLNLDLRVHRVGPLFQPFERNTLRLRLHDMHFLRLRLSLVQLGTSYFDATAFIEQIHIVEVHHLVLAVLVLDELHGP